MTLDAKGEGRFVLKHGQKITITGLPGGVNYKVTEAEANQDGYKTTETGVTGTITRNEVKTAKFVNDKPDNPPPTTPENPSTPENPTNPSTPDKPTNPSTPENPTNPSTPENPTNPGNPGNSNPPTGGGRTRRDRTPSTPQPPTTIPQEEVPLTNFEPEEVPLASLPSDNQVVFVPIEDEGIPLFGLPRTGDRGVSTGVLLGMMISSFMVACGIHAKRRKEKEE